MEVEIRGRWKGQRGGRVFYRYVNAQQAFEDANVAATLCRGGPIRYKVKDGVELTDAWLFEHVVPNLCRRYPSDGRLCRVLGEALLYICLSSNEEVLIPAPLRDRVKAAYAALGLDEEQPLEKVALHVYRMPNGTFGISDVVPNETDQAAGPQRPGAPMTLEMGQTILIQVSSVKQDQVNMNLNLMQAINEGRAETRHLARVINNNVRAYGGTIQGSLVRQRASNRAVSMTALDEADQEMIAPLEEVASATLSNNSRSLVLLWQG